MAPNSNRSPSLPSQVDDFKVLRELGQGGMAVVYLARQISLDRLVALKVLPPGALPSAKSVERFRREALAAAKLHHPHIVPVFTVGDFQGTRYIAMEYVQGATLDQVVAALRDSPPEGLTPVSLPRSVERVASGVANPEVLVEGDTGREADVKDTLTPTIRPWDRSHIDTACRIAAEIAEALQHAHEHRVYHRDVKPANILLDRTGKALLMDFGLAHEEGTLSLTQTGEFTGTPLYIAPEQIDPRKTKVDHRCDVYSLGVTLYELVTLKTPFSGRTVAEIFRQVLNREPTPPRKLNSLVSRELETVILKAVEKLPDDRYATAAELAEDLRRHLALLPVRARRASLPRRSWKLLRRHRVYAASLVILLATVLILTALLTQSTLRARAAESRQATKSASLVSAIERALDAEQLDAAYGTLAELRAVREDHPRLAQLERRYYELTAEHACEEGRQGLATYREALAQLHRLEAEAERAQALVASAYTSPEQRHAIRKNQVELLRAGRAAEDLFWSTSRQLNISREWLGRAEQSTRVIDELVALLYLERYEETVRRRDTRGASTLRREIAALDVEGRLHGELAARGRLTLTGSPLNSDVYLYGYFPHDRGGSSETAEPRLVPVPLAANGQPCPCSWQVDFYPGDLCLLVRRVAERSPFAGELASGDLIIALNGERVHDRLYVASVDTGAPAAQAGVEPGMHLVSLDGASDVSRPLLERMLPPVGYFHKAVFGCARGTIEVVAAPGASREAALGVKLVSIEELLGGGPGPAPLTLTVLAGGIEKSLRLEAGGRSGLSCELTAYPLIFGAENRMGKLPLRELELPPGSYLAVLRAPGYEPLRLPFVMPRHGRVELDAQLLAEGESPEGFAWIPPGPCVFGGDGQAYRSLPRQEISQGGFWIQQREVTYGEWHEFLADPSVAAAIEKARAEGRTILLPRTPRNPEGIDQRDATGRLVPYLPLQHPVIYVSHRDIQHYLEWMNGKLEEEDAHFRVDLPSEHEWEQAARGADERLYPWGDQFDPGFCYSLYARPVPVRFEAVGSYPWDESPFGIRDMAGSVREWLSTPSPEEPVILCRGGSMAEPSPDDFRIGARYGAIPEAAPGYLGFRLVARPIDR
ncbi:MAG: protein kinase [Planctomycetota bacterium]